MLPCQLMCESETLSCQIPRRRTSFEARVKSHEPETEELSSPSTYGTGTSTICSLSSKICGIGRAVASATQPAYWWVSWHHTRTGSILIMTTDEVRKNAGFRRMNVENRWNVVSWNALRGLPWDVTEREAEAADAIHAPHYPSASCATSALRHEGRLETVWCDNRLCSVF